MPLDPQARALLDKLEREGIPPANRLSVPEARRLSREVDSWLAGQPEAVAIVKDATMSGPSSRIPIRIYAPRENQALPVLVYLHGGGWVLGDLDGVDSLCRSFANAAGCVVASVDYRLAPEHKFPAAVEDSYSAIEWVARNAADLKCDPKRIAVGGDSAGGNLAAAASLMARDKRGPPVVFQLLIYPITNHAFDTVSYSENAEGYWLSKEEMKWFWNHYLRSEQDGSSQFASPLTAKNLDSLPPAFVITAEFDPLRDEGEAYAARLRDSGVPVKVKRYNGMIHGFINIAALQQSSVAIGEAAAELRKAFATTE